MSYVQQLLYLRIIITSFVCHLCQLLFLEKCQKRKMEMKKKKHCGLKDHNGGHFSKISFFLFCLKQDFPYNKICKKNVASH